MGILLTAEQGSGAASLITMVIMYAVIIAAFYFIFLRPQKKEEKKLKAMIAALEIGDYVLTTSGFYGSIIDITEDTVIVEFGNNKNCRIPMTKNAISQVEKPGAAE